MWNDLYKYVNIFGSMSPAPAVSVRAQYDCVWLTGSNGRETIECKLFKVLTVGLEQIKTDGVCHSEVYIEQGGHPVLD